MPYRKASRVSMSYRHGMVTLAKGVIDGADVVVCGPAVSWACISEGMALSCRVQGTDFKSVPSEIARGSCDSELDRDI